MSDALTRVQDLLRLASDDATPIEEARAAAYAAAKMIKKHELTVVGPEGARSAPSSHQGPFQTSSSHVEINMQDLLDMMMRTQHAQAQTQNPPPSEDTKTAPGAWKMKQCPGKFQCASCGRTIPPRSLSAWRVDRGYVHPNKNCMK